ncbi:hypothetical protein KI688_002785 [Linnemannia hyalina]|uniref:Exonuclease 1 n=1 Tax=Linnemannia hyalina TaxID=64524 RepID=A0A9P7XSM9_9FUNG|nr:hypothetical protein KI688_002785 [Linnemannia hyalina]
MWFMGVNGLPGEIKNATGIAPAKMNGKEFHVDMNGTYYGLMKARAYSVVQKYTTTLTRNTEPANLHMPQMEDAPERPESTDSASPDPNDAQADLLRRANMLFGLKDKLAMVTSGPNSPDSVVVDKDGMLQDGTDQQRVMFFGHIADELYRKLSQFCTPEDESVTLHFDGEPSIQKQAEHRARDDKLRKGTDALHQAIEQARVVGGSRRKAAYKRCRNLYKPTTVIQGEVIAELIKKYDCHVCLCRFQSDTCIAKLCAQSLNPQDIIVVSGDSDLICFGAVPRVLYPIGKSRELTLFEKDAILEVLDLPSERHLLLAAVVTGNDYTRGVPYFGIKKICEIIREMELPGSDVESFHWYVHEFLVRVRHQLLSERVPRKKRKRIDSQLSVTVDDFEHALSAFVGVQEDAVSSVDQNPHPQPFTSQQHTSIEQGGQRDCNAHEIVMRALLDLEYQKVAEAQERAAMGFTPPMEDKKPAPKTNVNRTRTAKTQRARREAAKRNRKRKKWRKSRFKSRTDNQVRYSPHRVSDPSTATPVSDNQLSTMSPSQPKKRPVDKQPKAVEDSPSASSSSSTDRSSKNKRRKASSKKKLARPRDIDATPTAPKLKDAFKFAFPTITQTVGSLKGCLRRSLRPLGISDDQVDTIASRLEKATSLINEARPHVFRMIQLFLLEEVTTVFSPQGASGETNVDLLDLVMNKASGQMFIRGLMSLALNGKIVEKKCKKSESIRARELAQRPIQDDHSPLFAH